MPVDLLQLEYSTSAWFQNWSYMACLIDEPFLVESFLIHTNTGFVYSGIFLREIIFWNFNVWGLMVGWSLLASFAHETDTLTHLYFTMSWLLWFFKGYLWIILGLQVAYDTHFVQPSSNLYICISLVLLVRCFGNWPIFKTWWVSRELAILTNWKTIHICSHCSQIIWNRRTEERWSTSIPKW